MHFHEFSLQFEFSIADDHVIIFGKHYSDELDEILSKRPTRTSMEKRPEEFDDLKKLLLDIQLEMKTNKEELEAKLVNLEDSVTKLRRCNQNPLRVKII